MKIDFGKLVPLLGQALADGKLDAEEVQAIMLQLALGQIQPPQPAPTPVIVGTQPAPPTSPPPPITNRPAGLSPAELVVRIARVTVSGPRRTGAESIPFHIEPGGQIVLDGSTTGLDDGSILNFDAEVEDLDGNGITIDAENHPELMGMLVWRAANEAGQVGGIGGRGMNNAAHVEGLAHFLDPQPPPGMWRRSGGMSVTVALRTRAAFTVGFAGGREAGPIMSPDVR